MLGRRGAARDSKAKAPKKRKWQEELDSDSDGEAKITHDDLEAFRKSVQEEEKEEQRAREKQEAEERERKKRAEEEEKEKKQKAEEEEARLQKEAEEARKQVDERETELRRQESLAPPGALPPDVPGSLPHGMNPTKMHLYKTSFCKRWEQGMCNFGATCHFAHGERDLRRSRPTPPAGPSTTAAAATPLNINPPPAPVSLNVPASAPAVVPPRLNGQVAVPPGGIAPPAQHPASALPQAAAQQLEQMIAWAASTQAGPSQADWSDPSQAANGTAGGGQWGAYPGQAAPSAGGDSSWDMWDGSGSNAAWQQSGGGDSWSGDAAWSHTGGDGGWNQGGGAGSW